MSRASCSITLQSPEDMAQFARRLAPHLQPGTCVLLDGPIGAGKSHFARSAILALLDVPEDIPSPTFTLVQTYDTTAGEVWHADLYRLSNPYEVFELGLEEAFETAICFIEWPDRLGSMAPDDAITLSIKQGPDENTRIVTVTGAPDDLLPYLGAVHA